MGGPGSGRRKGGGSRLRDAKQSLSEQKGIASGKYKGFFSKSSAQKRVKTLQGKVHYLKKTGQ